jgi:hypothetical protein
LDLDICLVKIMVEVYVQQKTYIKYLIVVAFQKWFLLGNASKNIYFLK